MAQRQPTFYRLDGRTGRRTAAADGISVDRSLGLVLAAEPDGSLGLASADGSLGGLRMPRGMALDTSGLLHLLVRASVRRFEPESARFLKVPGIGGQGAQPRELYQPRDLAIAGGNLYIADTGNLRVQVFDLNTLALVHSWTAPAGLSWIPYGVTSLGSYAFILDRERGRVFRHRAGRDPLALVVDWPAAAGAFSGLAVDGNGRIYLLATGGQGPLLQVFGADGEPLEMVADAGQVRSRFAPPPIRADHRGRFCLPESLTRLCDRRPPMPPPRPDDPLGACRVRDSGCLLFDSTGRPVRLDPEQPPGPPAYVRRGTWWSEPLDSDIHRCQWHRVDMALAALPSGTRVSVSTLTSDQELGHQDVESVGEDRWLTHFAIVGALQPPPEDAGHQAPPKEEFLIQSLHGRYLWLRIELEGDGYSSPAAGDLVIHFPRRPYLEFLPALYSAEEESRWFLERFLSIIQCDWDNIGDTIDTIRRLFDPQAVPDNFIPFLAGWLGLPLEDTWPGEQNRRLLAAAPEYYARRGTVSAIRQVLQTYLWNMIGLPPELQGDLPAITEGFRERQHLMLSTDGTARLGESGPLWSRSYVGRLQIGVFAREGEVRLVSTGDPERDLFHEYAHRFRVFVPSGWVRTNQDEAMLRRAIDAEKPAHTQYELCLVEPYLRLGVQSTVGIDSVLGEYSAIRLACRDDETDLRPPRQRLGIDTVLAGAPGPPSALSLSDGDRLGIDTQLM